MLRRLLVASQKAFSPSHYFSTFVPYSELKRIFPLLVKQFHPDFFAKESSEVVKVNMLCTRQVTEIWSRLQAINTQLKESEGSIRLRKPLNISYLFDCYVMRPPDAPRMEALDEETSRPGATPDAKGELVRVICRTKVPLVLSETGNSFPRKHVQYALEELYENMGAFLGELGLHEVWKRGSARNVMRPGRAGARAPPDNQSRAGDEEWDRDSYDRLDAQVLERIAELVIRQTSRTRARQGNNLSFTSPRSSVPGPEGAIDADVQEFIGQGHVCVKGLSKLEEVRAVKNLESFLVKHRIKLNFSMEHWWRVIIILDASCTQYTCRKDSIRTVIEIPASFKAKTLSRCLLEHGPVDSFL
jgi:hypothetical protein